MVLELKVERVRRGASQMSIALRVGISTSRLSLIERGVIQPSAAEAERLAELFGVNAARLFREVGHGQDRPTLPPAA